MADTSESESQSLQDIAGIVIIWAGTVGALVGSTMDVVTAEPDPDGSVEGTILEGTDGVAYNLYELTVGDTFLILFFLLFPIGVVFSFSTPFIPQFPTLNEPQPPGFAAIIGAVLIMVSVSVPVLAAQNIDVVNVTPESGFFMILGSCIIIWIGAVIQMYEDRP